MKEEKSIWNWASKSDMANLQLYIIYLDDLSNLASTDWMNYCILLQGIIVLILYKCNLAIHCKCNYVLHKFVYIYIVLRCTLYIIICYNDTILYDTISLPISH